MSDSILDPITRLTRDLKVGALSLGDNEARFLVDSYYTIQDDRKRSKSQLTALEKAGEPNSVIQWFYDQNETLEEQIKLALDLYTESHPMGSYMRSIFGIGPVISAGLLAHIDITKAPTAGHIWQYAGIAGDNQRPWLKGQKRPFNAKLKTLLWKAGQSFMKFSNNEKCYYGHVYRARKEYEIANNESGKLAAQAAEGLTKVGKNTEAYKYYSIGKLPPGRIDARARRYAVKLFISHLHGEWYRNHYKTEPPMPYPIAMLENHTHFIPPPHIDKVYRPSFAQRV